MMVGAVLMASGFSSRYGKNKLLEVVAGKPLVEHAICALGEGLRANAVVVTRYDEVEAIALRYGVRVVRNERAEQGVSSTIKLGLDALGDAHGYLFMVCDQPYLTASTVIKLVNTFRFYPKNIVSLAYKHPLGHIERGNPVIFPAHLKRELMELEGEESGADVIKRHNMLLKYCLTDARQLLDIDSGKAQQAKNLMITGARNIGKSTLVGGVLHKLGMPYGGFCTLPYQINGSEQGYYLHALGGYVPPKGNDKPVTVRMGDGCIPIPFIFDELGAPSIHHAIENAPLIVMDELGIVEEKAGRFKAAVFAALDCEKPVLGVLKQANGAFISAIAAREDVILWELKSANFDSALLHACEVLLPHCLVGDDGDGIGEV